MGKKMPDRPQYEQLADTPWITKNRDLNANSYANLNTALNDFRKFNINNNDYYQSIADAYTNAQWNDLNRAYNQQANQLAARERQRLGTSGSSSSAYNTDSLNRNYDYLASQVASNTANQYNDLVNQAYNRGLSNIDLYNNLFRSTGNETQRVDENNWRIRLQNQDNAWLSEVDDANSWNKMWDNIIVKSNEAAGAIIGGIFGGGQGAALGKKIGGMQGGRMSTMLGTDQQYNTSGYNMGSSVGANLANAGSSGSGYGGFGTNNFGNNSWGLNTSDLTDYMTNSSFADIWGGM